MVNKADAELILQNRPPEVPREELETALKIFTSRKFSLTPGMKPSKGFYERMLLQVETSWKLVSFTKVTNSLDDDSHNPEPSITVDGRGNFKIVTKDYKILMPKDALALTARFRTWAVCMYLLDMKYPGEAVLRTVEIEYVDRYVEWLFGPEVRGEAAVGEDGKPISTPTMAHAVAYDYKIR